MEMSSSMTAFTPVGVLLLLLAIAALAVWLYSRFYRKHINRVLEDENADIGPAPAPQTAGKVVTFFLICVVCAIAAFAFFHKLQAIDENVQSMQAELDRRISDLESSLWNIQSELKELRAENSLFLSFDYEITDVNVTARTATVSFRAVPKTATPEATVTLSYNQETIKLARDEGGTYIGSTQQSLFADQAENGTLCLTDFGQSKTETVTIYPDLRSFFPQVSFSLIFDDVRLDNYTLYLSGQPELTVWMPEKIHNIHLLFVQKDEVLKDLNLSAAMWKQTQLPYVQEEFSSLSPVRVVLRWEDSYGLIHEVEHSSFAQSSAEDDPILYQEEPDGLEKIYDQEGNFLGELR